MTTQAEARLFHLSREESVLVRARDGGAQPVESVAAEDAQGGKAAAEASARSAAPKLRLEVRRGARAGKDAPATEKPAAPPASAGDHANLFAPDEDDDGFADMRFPGAAPAADARTAAAPPGHGAGDDGGDKATATGDDLTAAIEAVKAERLSTRQLRIANRIAASHGITAASDEEAVVLLRAKGIDPLHRSALRRVVAEEGQRASAAPGANLPSVIPHKDEAKRPRPVIPIPDPSLPGPRRQPDLPSREALTEDRRATDIYMIQRDIARRRRRRLFALLARLTAFVALPTILAGWYYFVVATPLYATISAFQIQKAEAMSASGLGNLFAGTQLATNPDSVAVQSYLGSRDAMLRLDEEIGFKSVFQDPSIDPLLRLPPDASMEDAYAVYRNSVKISYDPTEGVIGMEVIAPDPQLSEQYSLALIRYAEDQVDQMSARLREDQMEGAIESYKDAEANVEEAQRRIQELQQQLGVLDPVAEGSAAMAQIAQLETELTQKQLELGQLQSNERPNQSRVSGVQGDIARLEQMIAERRAALTESSAARNSLASVTGELRIAEGDLLTRQQLLAAAAGQMEAARIEANKQVRYLSLAVAPVPPDRPTYPKAVQNTIVAFLIFAGIYLMLSLTASILREQVST